MAEELAKKFGNDLSVSIYQVIIDQNNGDVKKAEEQIKGFSSVEEKEVDNNDEDDFEAQLRKAEEMSKKEAAEEQERLLEKFKREKEELDEINRKKREKEEKKKQKKAELEKQSEEEEFQRQLKLAAEMSLKEEEKKFEEQQRRALEKFKREQKEQEERKKLKKENPDIKEEIPESSLYQQQLEQKRIEKEREQKLEQKEQQEQQQEKPKKKKKSIIIEEVDTLDDIKEVEEEINIVQEPVNIDEDKLSFNKINNDNKIYKKIEEKEEIKDDIYSFEENYGGFNLSNQYGNIFSDDQENPLNGENTFEVEIDMDQERAEKKEKQNIYKNKTQCFSITHSIPNLSDEEIKKITNEIIQLRSEPLHPKVCIYIRTAHKQGTQKDIEEITQFFQDNYQIPEKEIMNIDVSNDVELGYFLKTICKEAVSYPLVCINKKAIGNLETLQKYHQENKIKQLLDNTEPSTVYEENSSSSNDNNNVNNNNNDDIDDNKTSNNNNQEEINNDNNDEEELNIEEDKKTEADKLVDEFTEIGEEQIIPSGQYHGQNILDHCLDATEYVVSSVSSLIWLPVTIVTYPFRSGNDLEKKETDIEFDIVHTNFYWRNLKRKFRFSEKLFYRIHPSTLETRATHAYTTIKAIIMTNDENIVIQYNDKSQSDYICAIPEDIKKIISLILIRSKQANHNVLIIRPQLPQQEKQEEKQNQDEPQNQQE